VEGVGLPRLGKKFNKELRKRAGSRFPHIDPGHEIQVAYYLASAMAEMQIAFFVEFEP